VLDRVRFSALHWFSPIWQRFLLPGLASDCRRLVQRIGNLSAMSGPRPLLCLPDNLGPGVRI